ncbi:hypothetical protein ACFYZ3_00190 [Streptomyces sp. NPDC001599]|uniref:hypothetical protein n=1 Tax=Streptomyces sp. NPDC001599 TaxID=3364591 RepID=UPI003676DB62
MDDVIDWTPTMPMEPQDFLNSVAGYTQQTAPETSATKPVKLATVMVVGSNNAVQVQFDGETVTSTKYYPCLASYGATVGDRVALMPTGTTYLVIGAVGDVQALSGTSLTTTGNATIGGTVTASNFKVNTDWTLLSVLGSFVNGAAAGNRPPRVRSVTILGTVYWEMAGQLDISGWTRSVGTLFSFTGGSGSAWAPSFEHNFSVMPGAGSNSSVGAMRAYWNSAGNMGISPAPSASPAYISLDLHRIVDPKNQIA